MGATTGPFVSKISEHAAAAAVVATTAWPQRGETTTRTRTSVRLSSTSTGFQEQLTILAEDSAIAVPTHMTNTARTPPAGRPIRSNHKDVSSSLSFSDEDLDEPSLTLSDASDSFASLDDFLSWSDAEEAVTAAVATKRPRPRGVAFHPHVEVREYSLTISDHPFCDDPYPLSLDWAHARPYLRHIDESKSRGLSYTPGPRICVEAKRHRLAEVRGCSESDVDEMIRSPNEFVLLGRLLLFYITILLRTIAFPRLKRHELDDEYLFLYAGISDDCAGTMPPPVQQVHIMEHDLEAGLY